MKLPQSFARVMFLAGLGAAPLFAAAADEPAKDLTIEEFLQQLSTVQGVVGRKDPFAELPPPFNPVADMKPMEDPNAPDMAAPILERYTISEYEVVAVLLGDKYPRALLRLPGDSGGRKVVIVKEGDKLGNRKGVISKILAAGVVVQQAMRTSHGFVDKTEALLKVGGHSGDQRAVISTIPRSGGSE
jgi:hypothetical protein